MNKDPINDNSPEQQNFEYKSQIRVFHSFEEAEDYNSAAAAKQDPIERVRNVVKLILRMHQADQSKSQPKSNKIFIDKA
jgi:hypothetical protein